MIKGWLYPADSSARSEAGLSTDRGQFIVTRDRQAPVTGSIRELVVSQRVGNITRKITLPDKSLFETTDNDAVDALLAATGHNALRAGIIHILESRWQWIALALLATLLTGFAALRWGMPWASNELAFAMPARATEIISAQTLELLDQAILEESALPVEEQHRIRQHFETTLLPLQRENFTYRLHFRHMSDIPNAFALPAGDIVITDRLIELADNQEEIDSVLLHEIGHVVHRHGLQQVLHSSFLTIAIIMISGDLTATSNIAVALPVFLLESQYSREHETEADHYAFEHMMEAGIDPVHFSTIMDKISSEPENEAEDNASNSEKRDDADLLKYLSTHPSTPERILQAEKYSREFRKRLSE
ncbi:MAG: M48 family metallopeptidase [Gammaproteobacteria bacterium]